MIVRISTGGASVDTVNATPDKVLETYTYNDSDGESQTGTMHNNGKVSKDIGVSENYNGSGYYDSISINGPTLTGNALAEQVLSGQTFYNSTGTMYTGTMNNQGQLSTIINNISSSDTNLIGAAGYYTGINISPLFRIELKQLKLTNAYLNTTFTYSANSFFGISNIDSTTKTTSVKIFTSGGYIWATRNAGVNFNGILIKATPQDGLNHLT